MYTDNPTAKVLRSQVEPGMIIHSSHGYRLLITEVQDNASIRSKHRHVGFVGHLHANPKAAIRTERYEAGSLVDVEIESIGYNPELHVYDQIAEYAGISRAAALVACDRAREDGIPVQSYTNVRKFVPMLKAGGYLA